MNYRLSALIAAILLVIGRVPAHAVPTVIDFESLAELEVVTTQLFPPVVFVNTLVLTVPGTLEPLEAPPHSGVNVVTNDTDGDFSTNDGGIMAFGFSVPVSSVGAFFTYLTPITLTAFDASLTPVGSATSDPLCGSNLGLSGDPGCFPNEELGVAFPGGISFVTIEAASPDGLFVMDDLTFNTVPEPSTFLLLGSGLVGAIGWRTIRRRA